MKNSHDSKKCHHLKKLPPDQEKFAPILKMLNFNLKKYHRDQKSNPGILKMLPRPLKGQPKSKSPNFTHSTYLFRLNITNFDSFLTLPKKSLKTPLL